MSSEKPSILVVDDDDAGRFVKAQVMRRAGMAVEEAATGQEALDRVERHLVEVDERALPVVREPVHREAATVQQHQRVVGA